ncbi:hypothetical protein IPM09_04160 [Candidatus Saccharibacteria bacterium]|nr:MAG: hypothetical protein IPM09_04160 [Candidatus Saccharibacteria bacterium]
MKTLEALHAIDEPVGVSWLTAMSLQLDGDPSYEPIQEQGTECACCNWYGVFPVSTAELLGKKGAALALGDVFSVELNIAASSPADVAADVERYCEPVSDEEFEAMINGE